MNPRTVREAKDLFATYKKASASLRATTFIVCPPTPFLPVLSASYKGGKIVFGAQDVGAEASGAFTGEASALMVKSVGARYSIIGHSERRARGETSEVISKKVAHALEAGLSPILCVGEKERDHDGEYLEEVRRQIVIALSAITPTTIKRIIVAYEPVWAIGKGAAEAMRPHELHQMILYIRKVLSEHFSADAGKAVHVLYGGSVEPDNAYELVRESGAGGFLVGHASLSLDTLLPILSAAEGRSRVIAWSR